MILAITGQVFVELGVEHPMQPILDQADHGQSGQGRFVGFAAGGDQLIDLVPDPVSPGFQAAMPGIDGRVLRQGLRRLSKKADDLVVERGTVGFQREQPLAAALAH